MRPFNGRFKALLSVVAKHISFKLEYPANLIHVFTASEESSQNSKDVLPTNISYNTNQYFYEVFTVDSGSDIGEPAFILTIIYKDPYTGAEKKEVIRRSAAELLGLQGDNIRDEEVIVMLNQLYAGTMIWEEVNGVLSTYYTDYTSPLYTEYLNLLKKYNVLYN